MYNLLCGACAKDNELAILLDLIGIGPTLNQIDSMAHNKCQCNKGLIPYEKLIGIEST
jgi:hypothetical protein